MRRLSFLLAVIVAGGVQWPTLVVAQDAARGTGAELLDRCGESPGRPQTSSGAQMDYPTASYNFGWCMGLVQATVDWNELPDVPLSRRVCPPPTSTLGQWVRVVHRYLQDHPERLHEPDSLLAMVALREAFRCSP